MLYILQHALCCEGARQFACTGMSLELRLTSCWLHISTYAHLSMFCRELSKELQVNVLGYDYSGYGCSTGTPSVSNAVADVHACYHYLLQNKGKQPEDIVAYGQSVGSGPSCNLAAHQPRLKGLVLHSPLMSGAPTLSSGMLLHLFLYIIFGFQHLASLPRAYPSSQPLRTACNP